MPTVDETLNERGSRYGDFSTHAHITQALKHTMYANPGWQKLFPDQREALEMIAHKIGRILNGDPNYADSWTDIAGYAQLVARRLEGLETFKRSAVPSVTDGHDSAKTVELSLNQTGVAFSPAQAQSMSHEEIVRQLKEAKEALLVRCDERSGKCVDPRTKSDNKTRVYDVPRPPFTPHA